MLTVDVFKKCHAKRLETLNYRLQGSWSLTENIFLSHLQDGKGQNDCGVFYYDASEIIIKEGSRESLGRSRLGLHHGVFSREPDSTVMAFHFVDYGVMIKCINPEPNEAGTLASKVIAKLDGSDIIWFEKPIKIN